MWCLDLENSPIHLNTLKYKKLHMCIIIILILYGLKFEIIINFYCRLTYRVEQLIRL